MHKEYRKILQKLLNKYEVRGVLCGLRDLAQKMGDFDAFDTLQPVCENLFWLDFSDLGMQSKDERYLKEIVKAEGVEETVASIEEMDLSDEDAIIIARA